MLCRRWKVLPEDVGCISVEAEMSGFDLTGVFSDIVPVMTDGYGSFIKKREEDVVRRAKILGTWDRSLFSSSDVYARVLQRFYDRTKMKKFYSELVGGLDSYINGCLEVSRYVAALCSLKTHLNISDQYLIPIVSSQARWDQVYRYYNKELTKIIGFFEENSKLLDSHLYIMYDLIVCHLRDKGISDDYPFVIEGSVWKV